MLPVPTVVENDVVCAQLTLKNQENLGTRTRPEQERSLAELLGSFDSALPHGRLFRPVPDFLVPILAFLFASGGAVIYQVKLHKSEECGVGTLYTSLGKKEATLHRFGSKPQATLSHVRKPLSTGSFEENLPVIALSCRTLISD